MFRERSAAGLFRWKVSRENKIKSYYCTVRRCRRHRRRDNRLSSAARSSSSVYTSIIYTNDFSAFPSLSYFISMAQNPICRRLLGGRARIRPPKRYETTRFREMFKITIGFPSTTATTVSMISARTGRQFSQALSRVCPHTCLSVFDRSAPNVLVLINVCVCVCSSSLTKSWSRDGDNAHDVIVFSVRLIIRLTRDLKIYQQSRTSKSL